jgi:hypothetical protein
MVLHVTTLCSLVCDYQHFKKHTVSIFKVQASDMFVTTSTLCLCVLLFGGYLMMLSLSELCRVRL